MLRRITGSSRAIQDVISSSTHASNNYKPISYLNRFNSSSVSPGSNNPRLPLFLLHSHLLGTARAAQYRKPSFRTLSTLATPLFQQHHLDLPTKPRPDASAPHHDLQTFLSHAKRTCLSSTSSTYLGTRYEYLTQEHFQSHLSFDLTRVGRRGDSGIDLLGTWSLPAVLQGQSTVSSENRTQSTAGHESHGSRAIRVLVQCKRLTRNAGPRLIRELEGSFRGAPTEWRGNDVLGVMVCTMAATKGIRDAMSRSDRGLVWVMLQEEQMEVMEENTETENDDEKSHEEGDNDEALLLLPGTTVKQFLYNSAAASRGLEGVSVGAKYDETGEEKGVQLLWHGMPINFAPKK